MVRFNRATRIGYLVLAFIVVAIQTAHAQAPNSCPPCDPVTCGPTPTNCAGSVVKDACNCCDVCAKQAGESCEPTAGSCDTGLSCLPSTDSPGSPQGTADPTAVPVETTAAIMIYTCVADPEIIPGATPPPSPTSPPPDSCAQISADWQASYNNWKQLVNSWEQEMNAWKEKNKQ